MISGPQQHVDGVCHALWVAPAARESANGYKYITLYDKHDSEWLLAWVSHKCTLASYLMDAEVCVWSQPPLQNDHCMNPMITRITSELMDGTTNQTIHGVALVAVRDCEQHLPPSACVRLVQYMNEMTNIYEDALENEDGTKNNLYASLRRAKSAFRYYDPGTHTLSASGELLVRSSTR